VSAPAKYRSGTETNTLRLPGGKPIFVVSRQQFMQYPGYDEDEILPQGAKRVI
jgi:hypothetical protein